MRTIILKLTLDGENEYEYQDVSTLLVVNDFVLRHLPDYVDIQILSDSDDITETDRTGTKVITQIPIVDRTTVNGERT
jgi:hypothetical protein